MKWEKPAGGCLPAFLLAGLWHPGIVCLLIGPATHGRAFILDYLRKIRMDY